MSGPEYYSPKQNPNIQKWKDRPIALGVLSAGYRTMFETVALFKHEIAGQDRRYGLLQDSYIARRLWHPDTEGLGLVKEVGSTPDTMIAYDSRRPHELPPNPDPVTPVQRGVLCVVSKDSLQGTSSDTLTPTGTADLFRFRDLMDLDYQPPEEMIENGYLRQATYREVFKKQGLADHYAGALDMALDRIGEQTLYEVTPKGNGIVYLRHLPQKRTPEDEERRPPRGGPLIPAFRLPLPKTRFA